MEIFLRLEREMVNCQFVELDRQAMTQKGFSVNKMS
jgi:hypothetical protein